MRVETQEQGQGEHPKSEVVDALKYNSSYLHMLDFLETLSSPPRPEGRTFSSPADPAPYIWRMQSPFVLVSVGLCGGSCVNWASDGSSMSLRCLFLQKAIVTQAVTLSSDKPKSLLEGE